MNAKGKKIEKIILFLIGVLFWRWKIFFFLRSYHEFFEYFFFREIGFLTHTTLLKIFSSRIGDFGLSFSSSLLQ